MSRVTPSLKPADEVLALLLVPQDVRARLDRRAVGVLHLSVDLEDVAPDPQVAEDRALTVGQPELGLGSTQTESGHEDPALGLQP